jgi:putative transposase
MEDREKNGRMQYRFWQRGGGYDRNMTTPEIIRASIEYMHQNPMRRKLVEAVTDWKWSSAGFYAGDKNYPLKMDFESIPRL